MPNPYRRHIDLLEARLENWEDRVAHAKNEDDLRYCLGMLSKVISDLKREAKRIEA